MLQVCNVFPKRSFLRRVFRVFLVKVNKIASTLFMFSFNIRYTHPYNSNLASTLYTPKALSPAYPLPILYATCIYHDMFVCIMYIYHMYASMLILIRDLFWHVPDCFPSPSATSRMTIVKVKYHQQPSAEACLLIKQ